MDNFLREFREKVDQVNLPDAQPSDWESFKAYREGEGIRQKPVFFNRIPKKLIAGIVATLMIGISLWAYFAFPSGSGKKDIAVEANENREMPSMPGIKKSGLESAGQVKKDPDLYHMGQLSSESDEINEEKHLAERTSEQPLQPDIKAGSDLDNDRSTIKTSVIPGQKFSVEVARPDLSVQKNQDDALAESGREHSGTFYEVPDFEDNLENQPEWGGSGSSGMILINRLPNTEIVILRNRQAIELSTAFSVLDKSALVSFQPRVQTGASAHVIIPIEDRIGASFHAGVRIFADYAITDRLSIGMNWSKSGYTRTIPDKKMYPSLDEINPRSTEDQLEELTVDASFIKAGVFVSYDFLRFGGLKNKIGLGVQRDISTKFDFKMQVKDKLGAPHIQHQKKNIIPKSRYFISPQYQLSYSIVDQVNIYANAQYDISLALFREKYLSFDIGAAYVF